MTRTHRIALLLRACSLGAVLLLATALPGSGQDSAALPKPSFDGIDYPHPVKYLALPSSLGKAERIRKVALALGGKTPEEKLRAIARWIETNLSYDAKCAYEWRDFDGVLDLGKYGGCADHALVFGALARACGIPCVWVKTMDVDWIHEFKANRGKCAVWRGHVFLEVHLRGRWLLLDASQLVLYENYRPGERLLPGNRYAYDKGGDPFELVLSTRWELWKKATGAYFLDFDLTKLPLVAQAGRQLGDQDGVFIAADNPVYKWLTKRCTDLGYRVRMSFNADYGRILPRSRGNYLIVTCVGDRLVLDREYRDAYLPWSAKELEAFKEKNDRGELRRQLADGTRSYFLYGRDQDALRQVIDSFEP
jgi:hypothetical protein